MSAPSQDPFSVLIIDDEPDNRTLLRGRLKAVTDFRLEIEDASDGDEALKKLATGNYDLAFLDYRLPPSNGLEILDKMRQLHPKVAVVMTTAAGSEQIAVSAMKKGAIDYLTHKDLRQVDLAQLMRRVFEIRDLVNQNMELRQVNRMKNEFIANVSHELRTPLTVVIGYANTMRDGSHGGVNDSQKRALTAIIERAEGLLATLNNILRIGEINEGRKPIMLQPFDLSSMTRTLLARASKDLAQRKLRAEATLGQGGPWVLGDPDQLAEVIDNLLANAIKFSPESGVLKIEITSGGGKALLSVTDAGPGIAPEILPHIFEPFSAAHQGPTREYPGLGLGLPLSREIVEQHGGRLWLESLGTGKGAAARLELPLCQPDAARAVIETSTTLDKKKILIIEDNRDLVEVLMLFLSGVSRNLIVSATNSGYEALEKIKDETPDLVILDVIMPGMDGFEVISRLRRLPAAERIPVLVLTGYPDAAGRAKEAGAQEVLLKPFEKNVFVRQVLRLLQGAGD